MFSGLKLWPPRLLDRNAKEKAEPAFVPTTAIAARIVGRAEPTAPKTDMPPPASRWVTSFDPPTEFESDAAPPAELTGQDQDEIDEALEFSRKSDRFVPDRPATTLTDKRGKSIRARIMNVSATGVAVEADFSAMPPDTIALVGQKPVTLGRSIRRGQVFLFEKQLDPARCNPQIVL